MTAGALRCAQVPHRARSIWGRTMLYVKHSDGECHPVVRCHACDRTVGVVAEAVVVYPGPVDEGRTVRAVVAHRGDCLAQVVESLTNEEGAPHTLPLADYLARLSDRREVAC